MNRISKTEAAKKIMGSGGKFFGVGWTSRSGDCVANAQFCSNRTNKHRNQDKVLGFFTIFDRNSGRNRRVDSRTITMLNIGRERYVVR